jgi:hypothetical protein
VPTRLLVTSRASQDSKSWQEIGAEVLGVVKWVFGNLNFYHRAAASCRACQKHMPAAHTKQTTRHDEHQVLWQPCNSPLCWALVYI